MGDSEYVRMVRSNRYKYIAYTSGIDAEMLFDLENDPRETKNLAVNPAMKEVIEQHRALLKKWIARTNDKFTFPAR
jgi:choline-sulfatase